MDYMIDLTNNEIYGLGAHFGLLFRALQDAEDKLEALSLVSDMGIGPEDIRRHCDAASLRIAHARAVAEMLQTVLEE